MQTNRRDLLKTSIAFTVLSSMPSPLRAMEQKVLAMWEPITARWTEAATERVSTSLT